MDVGVAGDFGLRGGPRVGLGEGVVRSMALFRGWTASVFFAG